MQRTKSPPEQFLTVHQVAARYNVSTATIWVWLDQDKFPQPLRLTAGTSRWPLEDLLSWEAEKRAERARQVESKKAERQEATA